MSQIGNFDKQATEVRKTIVENKGEALNVADKDPKKEGLLTYGKVREAIMGNMKAAVREMDALRSGGGDGGSLPIDLNFESFVKQKFGFGSLPAFYASLGIDPMAKTISQLTTMPDFEGGFRWLIPEIIREATRLGLRRNPIYPELIAGEESVSQMSVTMPQINMSAAAMSTVNEAETIPVGSLSFGEKTVKIKKVGTGLKISDEVLKYVPLNVLSIFLQDAGVKLGLGLDTMAIDVLVNGDEGGNNAASVIGVADPNAGITYKDILRVWIRMGRLGRLPQGMISDEDAAMVILETAEFKGANYNNTKARIDLKTPIPATQNYLIHGNMPGNGGTPKDEKLGFYDRTAALLKLNASGLMVESERIAEKQVSGTYVTITTGFTKLFDDAFIILDGGKAFSTYGWPESMNINAAENVIIS